MPSRRSFIQQSTMAGLALSMPGIGRWFLQDKNFSYRSDYIHLQLSSERPSLLYFSTDSLGKGQFKESPLLKDVPANHTEYKSVIKGSEMTRDWKTWNGECWGYEGFLVDNYLPFLAVHDWHKNIQK